MKTKPRKKELLMTEQGERLTWVLCHGGLTKRISATYRYSSAVSADGTLFGFF